MSEFEWPLVRKLFDAVVELPGAERAAHLERAATPPAVRAEVERMLRSDGVASGFLESSSSFLGQALLPRMGTRLGRYELKRVIASGGMGTVFEAVQDEPRRVVALKTLRLGGFASPERLQRFRFEAEVLGHLRHPSIAQVFEAGTHEEAGEDVPFIAMELVPGARDLVSYAREEQLSVPERLELFLAVCEAVQHGHQRGVIHRDLKPGNILIDAEGQAKVIDFGVARATARASAIGGVATQTGQILGTLAYMAPEQLAGNPESVDVRSDVYALGVVLFELLEGRPPHELADKSPFEALRTIHDEPPRPTASTPRELGWILEKALAKEPERRYGSVSELADDLRRYLRREPVLAGPPSVAYRLSKWIKRNPAKTAAATIGVAAFAAVTWLLVQNVQANRALRTERTSLASTNIALMRKTAEAEENARLANDEKDRADREAEAATKRADEVLRLSALQKLDDLVAEADRLWPAVPENSLRYDEWLNRARELVAELPIHEKKLAELRAQSVPWTDEEQTKLRLSHPKLPELENAQRHLDHLRKMQGILESGDPAHPAPMEIGVDFASLPSDASGLDALAWPRVDPERRDWGGEASGLVLAQRAVELARDLPAPERASIRSTLAWALFAAGRFDEAMVEQQNALEEAGPERKAQFEGYVEKLTKAIEERIGPEGLEEEAKQVAELEQRITALEAEVSSRPEWTFEDSQDLWWHTQLVKLVDGLRAFADPSTGLLSEGTSPEHGWGVGRRLEFSRTIAERSVSASEASAKWAEAIASIANAAECPPYGGLRIAPQLGLQPIGRAPDSGLWEFAHLQTGEPAAHGADGKLILKEVTGLVFVLLPGGRFLMGAQSGDATEPNYDPQANVDERPVHEVMLSPFFISKYEMTQGQWSRFVGSNPSYYSAGGRSARTSITLLHPVEQVSWSTCDQELGRLGLSLPSEAQWEYACRAGTDSPWSPGDNLETLRGFANIADEGSAHSYLTGWTFERGFDDGWDVHCPVGTLNPNDFGLHEMHGNVWEWCQDGYQGGFYREGSKKDPVSNPTGSRNRVYRGGGFDDVAVTARSADRVFGAPSYTVALLGLRPARALTP